jgi:hypothetical protein
LADFILVGETIDSMAPVPAPDDWGWALMDISAPDAGRTQDGGNTMHKMRVGQKRKLSPTWKNRSDAQVAQILRAFNPEYVYVRYLDAMDDAYQVRLFYVGDRSSALRTVHIGGAVYSSLNFNLVER